MSGIFWQQDFAPSWLQAYLELYCRLVANLGLAPSDGEADLGKAEYQLILQGTKTGVEWSLCRETVEQHQRVLEQRSSHRQKGWMTERRVVGRNQGRLEGEECENLLEQALENTTDQVWRVARKPKRERGYNPNYHIHGTDFVLKTWTGRQRKGNQGANDVMCHR